LAINAGFKGISLAAGEAADHLAEVVDLGGGSGERGDAHWKRSETGSGQHDVKWRGSIGTGRDVKHCRSGAFGERREGDGERGLPTNWQRTVGIRSDAEIAGVQAGDRHSQPGEFSGAGVPDCE